MGYSGDINIARQRAIDTKSGHDIQALIPPSGATLFFDTMAIPKDAKNVKNAHLFINYILRPEVHAGCPTRSSTPTRMRRPRSSSPRRWPRTRRSS
jgi:spermidine/putrescine-binding protein